MKVVYANMLWAMTLRINRLHIRYIGIPIDHIDESEILDPRSIRCLSLNSFSSGISS